MTGIYRMAERNIRITSLYPTVQHYCEAYRYDGLPVFSVETTQADIDREREMSLRAEAAEGVSPHDYADAYLEELAVYRKIAEKMPEYDTVLFHGSAVSVDGAAYLFTAKSGTGKSTHTRLWRELLGKKAVMVNDDKPLIRITDKRAIVYGTPWDGKHQLSNKIAVPLKAVCILERAEENSIRPIARTEALPTLLQQTYRPSTPSALAKTLTLIDSLGEQVKFYRLGCNMDISAAELSYNAMKEGTT